MTPETFCSYTDAKIVVPHPDYLQFLKRLKQRVSLIATAMDPLSALSLAATLVQLVDFVSKIVSKGYHIYNATDRALPQDAALEYIVTDLQNLNARLKHHDRLSCATKDEQALEDLSTSCTVLANEVVSRLNRLKVAGDIKHRKWKSFRQALKSVWSKEELDFMATKLSEYRNQLEFHILLSLK